MKHIRESHERVSSFHSVCEGIDIYNRRELPDTVNIEQILKKIYSMLPRKFFQGVESIYVGEFDSLKKRDVDAVFQDGAIYIVPSYIIDQENLLRNMIHEIAHSVEELNSMEIYGDGDVSTEFIRKRSIILDRLDSIGYNIVDKRVFLEPEYVKEVDDFFYKEVGYPVMAQVTSGLFSSPYGCTSLREYFANSFEEYYLGSTKGLKKSSPKVYNKIFTLAKEEDSYGNF